MRRKDPAKTDAIRRQALELVVREGLDGFSMQKLARAAKVSPATLYIHFGNRETLLVELAADAFARMSAALLDGFDPDLPFARGLETQWRNRLRFFLDHPLEMRLLESVHGTVYEGRARAAAGGKFHETMCAFVQGAQERGELACVPLSVYWAVAYAPLNQLIENHARNRAFPGKDPFRLDEEILTTALRLAIKALTPAPPDPESASGSPSASNSGPGLGPDAAP